MTHRYADNMVKIYSVAVSMALTLVLSVLFLGQQPTVHMFYGISVITVSILMYFNVITPETHDDVIPHVTAQNQDVEKKT